VSVRERWRGGGRRRGKGKWKERERKKHKETKRGTKNRIVGGWGRAGGETKENGRGSGRGGETEYVNDCIHVMLRECESMDAG